MTLSVERRARVGIIVARKTRDTHKAGGMRVNVSEEAVIRFDVFELELKSGELRRAGVLVKLQPQPFKVLAFLAAQASQVVTREEIRRKIWGEETFVDYEQGVNFCIRQIRAALGDNAQSPRFIETL